MASSSSSQQQQQQQPPPSSSQPTPADLALPLFARGVVSLLTIWPALRLALSHGWSNKNATTSGALEKRLNLAEELVDAYYSSYSNNDNKGPESSAIEDFLVEYVEAEFGVGLEDGSEIGIARDLQKMWEECLNKFISTSGGTSEQQGMVERFEQLAQKAREEDGDPSKAFRGTRVGGQDDDESSSSSEEEYEDDEGEDGMMDVDPPQNNSSSRQKEEPIVDDDGFTMVTSKGKKGR